MMHLPDGYTEDEVLACITKAVNGLVSNFRFGYYDEEDLKQEGFLYAYEALPKYNPDNTKGCGLTNFLRVAIRNKFLNLRRNKLYRNSPPCLSCPFLVGDNGCSEFEDKNECSRWSGWNTRNQAKRSLVESCDVSKITHVTLEEELDVCNSLSQTELLQYVSDRIPLVFRADYRRFIEGARLNKHRKEAVVNIIRCIAWEILDDEDQVEVWQN